MLTSARGWDSLSRSLLQLCVGCAAFSVCVCAAQPRTIDKDELSRIKTIGVISTFGDKFHMFERGLTVFQNRESEHPIPEWKIDDEAVLITKRVLGRTFGIVPITTARRSEINEAHQETMFTSTNFELIERELRSLKLETPVDAFVILGKHRDDRGPWKGNNSFFVEGIGVFAGGHNQLAPLPGETELRDAPGPYGNRFVVPFAFYRISVIRASDFSPIGTRIAVMPTENRRFLEPATSLPFRRIHASVYKEEFRMLTEDDKRVIRKAITDVLEASISLTLKELGLTVE